ncbi:hypothetical protein HPB49_004450 [Dermacentor silvarum]|uniref:Uncharacterized protein n=1 Tax=Dermacentor silvarum TaxID=543639 RepID=A0ACB8D2X9_DERSI|nr:hypothetical protein HPB49_004450 [Dermacentor silvarum]
MKRAGFSLRRRTSVCQKLPATYEEKVLTFHRHFLRLRDSRRYLLGQIGNADQAPVYFDVTSNTTVSVKGARDVNLLTTGNEKLRFTVMLSCLADGTKLRLYIAFKRKTMPKETLPKGVAVRANAKGFMTDEVVVELYRLVWLLKPGASLMREIPNLLVLDSFRAHLTAKVKAVLQKERTDTLIIPGGLTGQLQPLDVGVNKPTRTSCALKTSGYLQRTANLPQAVRADPSNVELRFELCSLYEQVGNQQRALACCTALVQQMGHGDACLKLSRELAKAPACPLWRVRLRCERVMGPLAKRRADPGRELRLLRLGKDTTAEYAVFAANNEGTLQWIAPRPGLL